MSTVISVEHLSKIYQLGQIGTGTFSNDLKVWWAKMRGRQNPLLKIGQSDSGASAGEEIWALNDVSFNVERGEVLGIIGRNGAGKSTLLKILSRVTAPTSGKIKVKGRVASLLEVGTGFHPELTGRENIFLNGTILGMSHKEIYSKFDEIVAFAEIEKFIDTPVKRYSSGMYVRLAFAVAAHLDPEILVVDEVLAVGDAEFQKKCLGKMQDVAQGGRTVLFVSHNMAAVQNLCTTSILIQNGQLISKSVTHEVIDEYLQTSQQNSLRSIKSRTERNGTGWMRFQSIELLNQKMQPIQIGQTGQPLIISLSYITYNQDPGVAIIQLNINNVNGQTMFRCLSRNSYYGNIHLENQGKIICSIPKLPLLPGRYILSLFCKLNEVIADEIYDAFQLDVIVGDYYGTGKINQDMQNGMLVDHSWDFVKY